MPTANDEDQELPTPFHPRLEFVTSCKQVFTKCTRDFLVRSIKLLLTRVLGSRRLMVYRRISDNDVDADTLKAFEERVIAAPAGTTADELNSFRRRYFTAFKDESTPPEK